ncbi:SMI1/KNR4 family protein [uncultured Psychroserpens sp.]|uniref:SMI1/KNR4 family protein n=1 Tax=uncultured Psychroserpens sp. TaxID=255436 RepID=UPI00260B80BA|nr:SMI1/KNR4 family protein [uncultured Psychroserpens sp.]
MKIDFAILDIIMDLLYLQKLKDNKKIGSQAIEGVSEQKILETQQKLGIMFPTAYKEYLFLAGKNSGNLHMLETDDLETLASDFYKELLDEDLKETKTSFDRPFWAFASSIGDQGFWFFYLDENSENPETHYYSYEATEPYESIVGSHGLSFSELVDSRIDFGLKVEKDGIW